MLKRDTDYSAGVRAVEAKYGPLRAPSRAQHRTINIDTALGAHGPRLFSFRGTRYCVDVLPWRHGIAIEYLDTRIRALLESPLAANELRELEHAFVDVFDIMWDVARPIVPWWRRWRARRRNAFADATIGEYALLASFYFECQMQLPDLALDDSTGSTTTIARRRRTTSPIVLRNSQRHMATAGWMAESRAAITISKWGSGGSTSPQRATSSSSRTQPVSPDRSVKTTAARATGGLKRTK